MLESRPAGVGEARPRLTAVFHGSRLAAFYPSIRVPESFLREYRRQTFLQPILMGGKVVAIGSFFGIAIVLFIRLSRGAGIAWNRLWPGLAVAGALAAAALVNGSDTLLRGYETDDPLSLFLGARATVLLLGWLLTLCAAAVCFILISGARPGWRRALRAQGTLRDAFLRPRSRRRASWVSSAPCRFFPSACRISSRWIRRFPRRSSGRFRPWLCSGRRRCGRF